MNRNPGRSIDRRMQARLMRAANVPMRRVLGLPFATPLAGRLMLLTVTGRRSGKTYHQPVSYVRHGDVLLTPGGGRWTLNLAGGSPVKVRLAGRDLTARPELVTDPGQVEDLLEVMSKTNPGLQRFVRLPRTPAGTLEPTGLRNAIDHGFCVVRWHVDPAFLPSSASANG